MSGDQLVKFSSDSVHLERTEQRMREQDTASVLFVADKSGDADLVRLRLLESKVKFHINCVTRLSDALASLEVETPSLVLLDPNVSDSRGAETIRRIKQKAPNVPIVVYSSQDDEELAIKAVRQGAQDYIVRGNVHCVGCGHLDRSIQYAMERQALVLAAEANRKQQLEFKDRFLSHVSHELRTPLTCIHQYVTLLLDGLAGPLAPDQNDHLKSVLRSTNQLHAMILDLLEATRADSGKLRVEPRCVDMGELVRQAVGMMSPNAAGKHIVLECKLDPEIPLVYADPDRTLEVLINLLDNAIKFTPANGWVVVTGSLVETDPSSVYVSVSDSGRGIPQDSLSQVFDRLYQDPLAVDGNRNGLGLGLYIAREIVARHGGRMWVASDAGCGSTFSFTLPLYSLAKLLAPVITHHGRLRKDIVLVRVELTPLSKALRGSWKEICDRSLECVRRCIYVDKDLVLPPMETDGATETLYVVASTDMERVKIMMDRIRGQLEAMPKVKASGTLQITAEPIPGTQDAADARTLEQQVWGVADFVTGMIQQGLGSTPQFTEKENGQNAY